MSLITNFKRLSELVMLIIHRKCLNFSKIVILTICIRKIEDSLHKQLIRRESLKNTINFENKVIFFLLEKTK